MKKSKKILPQFLTKVKKVQKICKGLKKVWKHRLNDPLTPPYLAFVVFLSNHYETFLITFQSEKPLIHQLFNGMSTLPTNILQNFVNEKA